MTKVKQKPEHKIALPAGHILEEEFLKTDQSLRAYMELAFRHLGRMPVDNRRKR